MYVTTTQEEVCTEYITKTEEITTTQEQVQTSTVTEAPSTVYVTKTQEQVQTSTVTEAPSTVYVTKTQEQVQTYTVTEAPSTMYVTTTQEEVCTEYITKTEEVTTTQEQVQTSTVTEAPSTVYVTKTQEEVQTITTTQEEVQTVTQEQVQTIWVTKTQEEVQTVTSTQEQEQEQTQIVYVTEFITSCEVTSPVIQTSTSTTPTYKTSSETQTRPSQTYQASSCPTTLTGEWQFPHLIVPVNSSAPEKAYGTSYFGEITPEVSSIFNFDIPSSYSGMDCSLIFLFPEQSQLQTSSYTFSGSGDIDVAQLQQVATESTTYDTVPAVKKDYGEFKVSPGHSYSIATFACPASQAIAFEVKSENNTSLNYFQDYNPSPIGLYITACTEPEQVQWQNNQENHGYPQQNHQSWGQQKGRGQGRGWARSRFFRI
ncbi:hypothetical protein M433DRAFT_154792 [Acidomyces richmondensis BFW]|nr:MAG: hypothetical protein FE78DRAFT_91133 [Acidomyces sp. 'richmondensis']KYG45171.1 hypothetical protein M433DRAFT_154792 [Acidomyces richmondensis BFW]